MKVYVASNGDIFVDLEREAYVGRSAEDVANLIRKAEDMIAAGDTVLCEARESNEVVNHISYYAGGEFIATADIHIFNQYSNMTRCFFIRRFSGRTGMRDEVESTLLKSGALVPIAKWAKDHGICAATARQRAIRGKLVTARKIGNAWFVEKLEPLIDHRCKAQMIETKNAE